MAGHSRKKMVAGILVPFLVCILFFTIMFWQKYRSSHELPVASVQQSPENGRSVTLFFADAEGRLAREARETAQCDDDLSCIRTVLDELLNGSAGELDETIPEGTAVNTLAIDGEQASVDLNQAFAEAMPSGSSAEMAAAYSLVNTININFPHIHKVKITIEGNGQSVLRHLDLSGPLLPDYSLERPLPPSVKTEQPPAGPKPDHQKGVSR